MTYLLPINGKGPLVVTNDKGVVTIRMMYENDLPHGEASFYYESGRIMQTSFYKEGLLEGVSHQYDDVTGDITCIAHYEKGYLHGLFSCFLNKQMTLKCTYKEGKKHGEFILFEKNKVKKRELYREGEKIVEK